MAERLSTLDASFLYLEEPDTPMHVAGVLIESRAHRENLIKGMLTGRKLGAANDGIDSSHRLVAVAMLVGVGVAVGVGVPVGV